MQISFLDDANFQLFAGDCIYGCCTSVWALWGSSPITNSHLTYMFIAQNYVYFHAVDSPPSKAFPLDCPKQNNWSTQTKYHSHTWSPLCVKMKLSNPLEAVRRDKTMAPCTSVHSIVWTQATKISYRWSQTAKT